jgi:hypothetical protein
MRGATDAHFIPLFEQEYIRQAAASRSIGGAAADAWPVSRRMLGRFRRMHGSLGGCSGSLFSRLRDPEGRLQVAAFYEALQKLG